MDASKDKVDESQAALNKKVSLATLKRRQQQQLKQEPHHGRPTAQGGSASGATGKEEDRGNGYR